MARVVGIGNQDFETVRQRDYFYIDKTKLIKAWWERGDSVTLITRPRRFGKTLNMSMLEKFFSVEYAGRGELFEGLSVWEEERYRSLQGTWPVISLSFAKVKETSYLNTRKKICQILAEVFNRYYFLLDSDKLNEREKEFYRKVSADMEDYIATDSLNVLSGYLMKYYGRRVIILLDEYDTPMQEAYINGYWRELVAFTRSLFNATFKTNPCLERAVMTGITRVSKESVFSDLNNLEVVTTSEVYEDCFGFTEEEVCEALEEYGLSDRRQQVKDWYDGFTFGERREIYNPWSIINYLDKRKVDTYWANTSANGMVGKLIQEGNRSVKVQFEHLLQGESIRAEIDEQIVYDMLEDDEQAVWSFLLASGYLRVKKWEAYDTEFGEWKKVYELALTNFEVRVMFHSMVRRWFGSVKADYHDFLAALLSDDLKAMNAYMSRVTEEVYGSFDTGKRPSVKQPERFYHGFVLGLLVELADRYVVTSNRESGFGRYDIMLEPREAALQQGANAIIIEFKVQEEEEEGLSDTVQEALRQIEEKKYRSNLMARGIPKDRIREYGFAFCGKKVLIGGGGVKV